MFYVIDQGIRIQTPIDTLVRPDQVQVVEKTAAVRQVEEDSNIDNSPQHPRQKQLEQYQQLNNAAKEQRQPAVFAQQIMTQPAIAINQEETVFNALQLLKRQKFHHLPVTNRELVVTGIISDRDIMRFSINHSTADQRVTFIKAIMNKKVLTAAIDTEIRLIAEVMTQQRISALPITDHQNKLLGIVSSTDILRTLVNRAPLELWT